MSSLDCHLILRVTSEPADEGSLGQSSLFVLRACLQMPRSRTRHVFALSMFRSSVAPTRAGVQGRCEGQVHAGALGFQPGYPPPPASGLGDCNVVNRKYPLLLRLLTHRMGITPRMLREYSLLYICKSEGKKSLYFILFK